MNQLLCTPFVIMINRTAEFASIIASLPPLPSSQAAPAHPPPSEARVSFIKAACAIDGEIRDMQRQLHVLNSKVMATSLWADPAAEITVLTTKIQEALTHLSSQLDRMEALLPQASPYAGSSSARDYVASLLATLKSSAVKLTQEFSSIHKLRTESLKTRHERAKEYTNPSSKFASRREAAADPVFYNAGMHRRSAAAAAAADGYGGAAAGGRREGEDAGGEEVALLIGPSLEDIAQERLSGVRTIEKTIGELGAMFSKLAGLVSIQAEQIERIDTQVEDTFNNVNAGHEQLLQYYRSISSNRALICKMFAVLIFTIVLWVFLS